MSVGSEGTLWLSLSTLWAAAPTRNDSCVPWIHTVDRESEEAAAASARSDALAGWGADGLADLVHLREAGFDEGLLSLWRPISLLYGESLPVQQMSVTNDRAPSYENRPSSSRGRRGGSGSSRCTRAGCSPRSRSAG